MKPSHFLITGCGRSGTGYTATLLSALGLRCGHEELFCPALLNGGSELAWPDALRGECSWLAAPFLPGVPPEVALFHQVREPVAVIRSKVRTGFFEHPSWYSAFALRVLPGLVEGPVVERAMRYWVGWNRLVERRLAETGRDALRFRLEDLGEELVARIVERAGGEASPERIRAALAAHPRDYNSRGDRSGDRSLTWDSLPRGPLKDELRELASGYGYGDPGPDGTLQA